MLTATERGDLAERMLPVAARVACIVNGDGGAVDVQHALGRLDRDQLVAVIVCLGAMVDPDADLRDALGFITWNEHGRPLTVEPRYGTGTIRSLVPSDIHTPSNSAEVIEQEQRLTARSLYAEHGMGPREIAQHVPVKERTVSRWVHDLIGAAS